MSTTTDQDLAFVPPANVHECNERIALIKTEIELINMQLTDGQRRALYDSADEYRDWRRRAQFARAHLKGQAARLNTWRGRLDDERKVREMAGREQRRAAAAAAADAYQNARRACRGATIAAAPDPEAADLILRLHAGLTRLYRKSGQEPSEMDRETLGRACAYLVAADIFEL
jgi:hypothetical protein